MSVSHLKNRLFQPDKLSKPRDIIVPDYLTTPDAKADLSSVPLVLEIGAGKGKHAWRYALENPAHKVIAIERTLNKVKAFKKRVKQQPLPNLTVIHADAIPYCVYALPPQSVDTVFILYPNPEPNNPNQQWLNMPFFEFLLSRVNVQGKIIVASNIESYIETAYFEAVSTWQLPTVCATVPKHSDRTHFEIKYLHRNETCKEIRIVKPEGYCTHFDQWFMAPLD